MICCVLHVGVGSLMSGRHCSMHWHLHICTVVWCWSPWQPHL